MKKLLMILAVAGVMVSCNNKKKGGDDKPKDDTAKMMDNNGTNTDGGNTTVVAGVPTFADAEVQKYVEDYTAFVNSYMEAVKTKDMTKITDISMKAQEWSTRSASIAQKLANNPEEAKKFSDYMTKLSNDWAEAAKSLVPKM